MARVRSPIRRGWGRFFFAVIFLGLGLGMGRPAWAPPLPRTGGVLIAPLLNFPPSLDPIMAVTEEEKDIAFAVYDTLMEFNAEGYWRLRLAAEYKAFEEGRVWEIRIKTGVAFHDGRPVTAKDVAATLARLVKHPDSPYSGFFLDIRGARDYRAGTADNLAGVKVKDDYAVTVTLDQADPKFLGRLGVAGAAIVPADTPLVADPIAPPLGSGPFRLAGVQPGERIDLAYNPDYFNIRPYLDGIEFKVVSDNVTEGLIEFELGRLGLVTLPFKALWRFQHDALWSRQIVQAPTENVVFLELNCRTFGDSEARRGLSAAIDRNAMVEALLNGRATSIWTQSPSQEDQGINQQSMARLSKLFSGKPLILAVDPTAVDTGMLVAERIEVDLWKHGVRVEILDDYDESMPKTAAALRLWSPRGYEARGEIERGVEWNVGPQSFALASDCGDAAASESAYYPPYILLFSYPRRVVYARGVYDLFISTNGSIDFRNVWLDRETEGSEWRGELGQ